MRKKYKEGLITKEEYNAYIVSQRQGQYVTNIDGQRAELLEDVLQSLAEQGLLNTSQIKALESIQTTRAEYKRTIP
ncbi:hypothetical protein [Brachyspira pilosicoli]|uniref:hypothetical protein n=1 Tax=Brachyspira pilosicoli TaxID=52584 RepID=UPI00216173B2|nr:hypothetical protein [Brachyspira pilosicoli]